MRPSVAGQERLSLSTVVTGLASKPTLIGLACAAWLGGSVVFFRGASLSLGHADFAMAAAYTLFVSLVIQTALMGGYIAWRERGEITRVLVNWRWAGLVGLTGALLRPIRFPRWRCLPSSFGSGRMLWPPSIQKMKVGWCR